MDITVVKLIVPFLTSVIGAALGAMFTLSKTKKEKIWDEKRDLYNRVIVALEDSLYWAEQTRATCFCEYTCSIPSNIQESERELSRLSITGELIMDKGFFELLVDTNKQLRILRFNGYEDSKGLSEKEISEGLGRYAYKVRKVIEYSLPKLIEIARKDLPNKM